MSKKTWIPDTCQCIIEIDVGVTPNVTFVDYVQKCDIHKGLFDQAYLDAVLAHNQSFKIVEATLGLPTPAERAQNNSDKRTEAARILALGSPVRK